MNQKTQSPWLDNIYLGLILLVAFFLRFWDFWNIPFTFDELSAMSRTSFNSFSELIRVGVVERDTHPAGIQTFMFFWVRWFGEAEWIVKLPFMVAGLISVWLTYEIARLWFGYTNALLSAAYVASLQLFVMYGQIARPYISGLFFTLLMVYFWSNYFFGNKRKLNLVFFVLAASMCSYNHHFSLLFAAIVGLSGLFLLKGKQIIPYVLSGVFIFILYIPHLNIFFSQLDKGGIGGWLGEPSIYFPLEFLNWLFHYSPWVFGVLVLIVVAGFVSTRNMNEVKYIVSKRVLLLAWFLLPIMIGYTYSVLREPVIQYSLLIFSTPYLFMLIFSFVGEWKSKLIGIAVVLILITNVFTLIFSRFYYKEFYHQQFEQVVKRAVHIEKQKPGEVFIINDYVPYYSEYYFRKYGKEIPYFTVRNKDISMIEFKKVLAGINQNTIVTSGLKNNYFLSMKDQFPHWVCYDHGFTFEQYTLSKDSTRLCRNAERKLISQVNFEGHDNEWRFTQNQIRKDSANRFLVYSFDNTITYGLSTSISLAEQMENIYWFIDVEIEFKTDESTLGAAAVVELRLEKEVERWQSSKFSELGIIPGKWQKAFLTVDIQNTMRNQDKIDQQKIFLYLWNKDKEQFLVRDIKIFLRPGNPQRYSLLN